MTIVRHALWQLGKVAIAGVAAVVCFALLMMIMR